MTLVERAYQYLWQEIVSLRLKPGDVVYGGEVSKILGISRTPVREAMIRLKQDGLIMEDGTRRTIVTPITKQNVKEPFELREAIEGMAARIAAQRVHDEADQHLLEQIDGLLALHELSEKAIERGEPDEYFKQNWNFHEQLVALSGNSLLLDTFARIRAHLSRVDYLSFVTAAYPAVAVEDNPEHRAIIAAIREGAAEKAETLARAHVMDTRVRLLDIIARLNFGSVSPLDLIRIGPSS